VNVRAYSRGFKAATVAVPDVGAVLEATHVGRDPRAHRTLGTRRFRCGTKPEMDCFIKMAKLKQKQSYLAG